MKPRPGAMNGVSRIPEGYREGVDPNLRVVSY